MPVATQRRQDHRLLAGLLGLERLTNSQRDRMSRLRCRDDALGPCELHRGREALGLRHRFRVHHSLFVEVGDHRSHAVVAQAAGVDRVRDEVVAEGVHLHQGGHPCGVAEVVGVHTTRKRGTRRRLGSEDPRVHFPVELFLDEREGQSGEVRSAAGASDDEGRSIAGHLELQQRLLADHGLVQQNVVEDRTECVARVRIHRRDLHGFGDRDTERSAVVLGVSSELAANLRQVRGRAVHLCSEGLDHQAAVGLGIVRRSNLPDFAIHPVERAREGQCGAPLTGSGLGGQPRRSFLLVVVRLRHRGIRLMRTGR